MFTKFCFFHFYESPERKLIISCPTFGRLLCFRVILKVSTNSYITCSSFWLLGKNCAFLKLVFVIRFTNLLLMRKFFWVYKNHEKCLQNNIFFSFSCLIILITSYRLLKSGYKYPAIYIQNPLKQNHSSP